MMYEDNQQKPTIPPLAYNFKPHCKYYEAYTQGNRQNVFEDLLSSNDEQPIHQRPRIPKHRKTSPYYQTSTSSSSSLAPSLYQPEYLLPKQRSPPPPIIIPSRPGTRHRTRPPLDEATQNPSLFILDYQNDAIQHYDDITKSEMNIIYLDREPISDIHPLPVPPTNPHIVLDFLSRDHEWCTEHFQNIPIPQRYNDSKSDIDNQARELHDNPMPEAQLPERKPNLIPPPLPLYTPMTQSVIPQTKSPDSRQIVINTSDTQKLTITTTISDSSNQPFPQPTTPSSTSSKRKGIPQSPTANTPATIPSTHPRNNDVPTMPIAIPITTPTPISQSSTSISHRYLLKYTPQPLPDYISLDATSPPTDQQKPSAQQTPQQPQPLQQQQQQPQQTTSIPKQKPKAKGYGMVLLNHKLQLNHQRNGTH